MEKRNRRLSPKLQAAAAGLAALVVAFGALFWDDFHPDRVLFSNDGPYGAMEADHANPWKTLTGYWHDLNWLGYNAPATTPGITTFLRLITSTLTFSKLYAPFSLLFVGWAAWVWARQMRWSPWVGALLAVLTSLNGDFFATASWGVCAQPIAFGCNFLALAALARPDAPRPWLRLALAGFAVGLGVTEAYDIGALFSLVVAAYVVFQAWQTAGSPAARAGRAMGRLILVAGCAAFIAASTVSTLVATQLRGVVQVQEEATSREERWAWATQWSLPKAEFFSLLVPGLFGYRMDTPGGGDYWGRGGSDPAWDAYLAGDRQGPPPGGFFRYGMGSGYAGMLVWVLVAGALVQTLRRQGSIFGRDERRALLFWTCVAILATLLMFGRFAPFYQFFFALPYASSIRNPAKFMHILEWALLILSGYGLQGLWRTWVEPRPGALENSGPRTRSTPAGPTVFERRWLAGSAVAFGLAVVAWLLYAQARPRLEAYLTDMHLLEMRAQGIAGDERAAAQKAREQAAFSVGRVGRSVLFLGLALGWTALVISGRLRGKATLAGGLGCALAVLDLAPANRPWVVTYNWKERLVEAGNNPVFDLLRQRPWEYRVALAEPFLPARYALLAQLYRVEWMQHLFPFYNIQSPDIVQMPRVPVEVEAFERALARRPLPGEDLTNWAQRILRRWELTSTRYLFGAAGMAEALNQQLDPEKRRFRELLAFEIRPKGPEGPFLIRTNPTGPFALMEFTGALPKAGWHGHWQVVTNDAEALALLPDPSFDPHRTVLVADPLPAPAGGETNRPGTVEFEHYEPKRVILRVRADRPSVLRLNDKFDVHWHARVDGQPAAVLRCNYVVRGVYVEPGEHRVEFHYQPPVGPLYVSLAAIAAALVLLGWAWRIERVGDRDK